MNITQHALMRMLQREFDEYIINDSTFQAWKRANPDGVPKAEKELNRIFNEGEHTIVCPDIKGQVKKFKINIKDMWILVHDDAAIITAYPIEYSKELTIEANKQIFTTVFETFLEKQNIYNKKVEELKPFINDCEKTIEQLQAEYKITKSKLEYIESRIKQITNEKDNETKSIDYLKKELDYLGLKTVQPISFI